MHVDGSRKKNRVICRLAVWEWHDPLQRRLAGKRVRELAVEMRLVTPFKVYFQVGKDQIEQTVGREDPGKIRGEAQAERLLGGDVPGQPRTEGASDGQN